jgi:hypothetical protein
MKSYEFTRQTLRCEKLIPFFKVADCVLKLEVTICDLKLEAAKCDLKTFQLEIRLPMT